MKNTVTSPVRTADLRVEGELKALAIGLGSLGFILLLLMRFTLGAILILVVLAVVWVKIRQGQLLGQSVRVTEQQLPRVYRAARTAADRLSMNMPDVFVVQDPVINAYAIGFFGRKSVVLHSATVEAMDDAELRAIIGHEFSHIKCAHTHWLVLTTLKDTIRIPVISQLVGLLFLSWSRKAEYTCDRGGLVASEDLQASISALAKVAIGATLFRELNLEAFFRQRDTVSADDVAKLAERFSTHPYIVNRIHALHAFSRSAWFRARTATVPV